MNNSKISNGVNKIRTRFAPSPTGYLHIGGLRTALFNYLFTKQNKGEFILRIEDTDRERHVKGAEKKLLATLKNIGLNPDNKTPYIQSKRTKLYQAAADELIKKGSAYYCFCSSERLDKIRKQQQANKQVPKYDQNCRNLSADECKEKIVAGGKFVIRFKIPTNEIVKAQDLVYGEISVKTEDLDDFIIIKSDGYPTYHLANIIDDHEMKISHVIRGEEWLPSLPKHILLYQAFNFSLPNFIHLPLLLNPDKSKLSKRQGDVAVEDFLAKGYLKEALLNYVALLGWNPGDDREIFSLDELIKNFSLDKINKAGAVFDINKLNWFNAEYIRHVIEIGGGKYKNLITFTKPFLPKAANVESTLKLFSSRINNLAELKESSAFLFDLPDYPAKLLIFKKSDQEKTKQGLEKVTELLSSIKEKDWQENKLNNTLQQLVNDDLRPGDIFWPARVALSGLEKSPSPAEILEALGKKESLARIEIALKKLA